MPDTSNHLSTLTFLSPDAKSKAFDANGTFFQSHDFHSMHVLRRLDRGVSITGCRSPRSYMVGGKGWLQNLVPSKH